MPQPGYATTDWLKPSQSPLRSRTAEMVGQPPNAEVGES